MKHFLACITICTFLFSFSIPSGMENILNAIKQSDAPSLSRYFDNSVDITLFNKSNNYSRSQAQMVLRDFFAANPVRGFEVLQTGENAGNHYCIGNLITKRATYYTTIFVKVHGNNSILQEIRIERK